MPLEAPYQIRFEGSEMVCCKPGEATWKRAVYHDTIRQVLLDIAAGPSKSTYTHPRAMGIGNDVTAFHTDQKDWAEERAYRPKVLFQVMPPNDRKIFDPKYDIGVMQHAGRLVLDPDNRPVRAFREIPLTLSSKLEGWVMEAIRRQHSKITSNDFRARMPRHPSGQNSRPPTANALSMRQTRFREMNRCISWDEKAGSKAFQQYLWSKMTIQQHLDNSIEDMNDVENKEELEDMRAPNKGRFGSRRRKRAVDTNDESADGEADPDQPLAKRKRSAAQRKPGPLPQPVSPVSPVPGLTASTSPTSTQTTPLDTPPPSTQAVDGIPTFVASHFPWPTMFPHTIPAPALPELPFETLVPLDMTPTALPALPLKSSAFVRLDMTPTALPALPFGSSVFGPLDEANPALPFESAAFGPLDFTPTAMPALPFESAFGPLDLTPTVMPALPFEPAFGPLDFTPTSMPALPFDSAAFRPLDLTPTALPTLHFQSSAFVPLDLTPTALSTSLPAAVSAQTENVDWNYELTEIEGLDFGDDLQADGRFDEVPF